MATDNETPATGRTRARIVEQAQATVHEARSQYRRMVSGGADQAEIDAAAADLHSAVMDYWDALRPLSNKDVIQDEWDEGVVYSEPQMVTGEDGTPVIQKRPALRGWDSVEQFVGRTTTKTRSVKGFFGGRTVEETAPQRLPPKKLMEMSFRLDLMASELGFSPETPEDNPEDKL